MPKFVSNTIQAHIATFFAEIKDWKILLLKRATDLKIYPNIWQVITGTIEGNETALQTAQREIFEETGLISEKLHTIPYVTSFFNAKEDSVNFSPVFGMITNQKAITISLEHTEYGWFTIEECRQKLILPSHIQGNDVFYEYILKRNFFDFL